MKISFHLHIPRGLCLKDCHERIANELVRRVQIMERKGKRGTEYPITKEDFVRWIEKYCIKRKYLFISDKIHPDYRYYLNDKLYTRIMSGYLRKPDEIIEDEESKHLFNIEDDEENVNESYLPGLLYSDGIKAYYLSKTDSDVDNYEEERQGKIVAFRKGMEQRCSDAHQYLNLLDEHKDTSLLGKGEIDPSVS